MRIGIGLPAAVPHTDMTTLGRWATESEHAGFVSVGVIDRLVYDNLDPLTALATAAGCTKQVELLTTVLSIGWRNNPGPPGQADGLGRPGLRGTTDCGPGAGWMA